MSVPRTILRNSSQAARSFTTRATRLTSLSSRLSVPSRQIATSSKLLDENVETSSRGQDVPHTSFTTQPSGHARSIVLMRLNKRALPFEIESFLKSKGLEIKKWQCRLDRFTFQNDTRCFIELATEEQAQKAIEALNGIEFMHKSIVVAPMKDSFVWAKKPESSHDSYFFDVNEVSPSEALKPLLEERRLMFSVQPPGWGPKIGGSGHNDIARHHMERHLGQFGITCFSKLAPFYGDLKQRPRMLCFIDFETKSGADQAVRAFDDKEMEGCKVRLQPCKLAPWRAHQVGKVDKALLSQLQEKGLASTEPYEDKFVNSDRTKGAKYHKMTQTQRMEAIAAEKENGGKNAKEEGTKKEAKVAV
ncbi:hypothetical protein HBH76_172940 [Parastagonospora nodorum]|nr:hypothetical protein HBH76_172940 [Parastagonospora nodorum]